MAGRLIRRQHLAEIPVRHKLVIPPRHRAGVGSVIMSVPTSANLAPDEMPRPDHHISTARDDARFIPLQATDENLESSWSLCDRVWNWS